MTNIQITGNPLDEPIIFHNVPTDYFLDENHWLLTKEQAENILIAWRDTDLTADGLWPHKHAYRSFIYNDLGLFTAAMYMDGVLHLEQWESADGYDDNAVFSTSQLPFGLEVTVIE
ncbi:MAG: hypothetical protein ACOH1J_08140 [Microbacteriaceae bacterium]